MENEHDDLNELFKNIFGNQEWFKNLWETTQNFNKQLNIESGEDSEGSWEKRSWTSPDGSISYHSYSRLSGPGYNVVKKSEIPALKAKLQEALNVEDYDTAIKLRDEIANLEKHSEDLKKLEGDKKAAVLSGDYETARKIKSKIDKLKSTKNED